MIPMNENERLNSVQESVRLLAGVLWPDVCPVQPFEEHTMDFLSDLGKELRKDVRTAAYTDVAAFGFWCRKGNLKRLKEEAVCGERLGRGLVFHIAPSNVPVNFAYSYVLGLLSGNANIVRVSSKGFVQTDIICSALERLFAREEYQDIREQTSIMSYDHDKEVTDVYSSLCDARVIWGGDATIETIRESPVGSRCVEIAFADRYSIGLVRPSAVAGMDEEELRQLAVNFYNDTYLLDQNACTAPHVVIWLTDSPEEKQAALSAGKRFWEAVQKAAENYDLADIKVSDKYDRLCNFLADQRHASPEVHRYDNLLYVITVERLPEHIDELRGSFGMFFEYKADRLDELAAHITKKVQTAAVLGVDRKEVTDFIFRNHLKGIDRIAAVGQTLDMGLLWDGYDIIGTLSRVIG